MKTEYAAFGILGLVVVVAGLLTYTGKLDATNMMMILGGAVMIVRSIFVETKKNQSNQGPPSDPPPPPATSSVSPLLGMIGSGLLAKLTPFLLTFALGAFGLMGCSTVCSQIQANAPVANAKLADAQLALSEVEASGIRQHLSGSALDKFDRAMSRARQGHALASHVVSLGEMACWDPRPGPGGW